MRTLQFNTVFNEFKPKMLSLAGKYHKSTGIPFEELFSHLAEELWNCFESHDGEKSSFDTWSFLRLKRKAIDLSRSKEGSFYKRITYLDKKQVCEGSGDEEDAPTSEVADNFNVEDHVLERMHKKKTADQRQLIDHLIRTAKPDATTTTIVEAFLTAPPSASPNSIAKSIGVHPQTVKRKLQKLSRNYDEKLFGDVSDYLAV